MMKGFLEKLSANSKENGESNDQILKKQYLKLAAILLSVFAIFLLIIYALQSKKEKKQIEKDVELKIEVANSAVNGKNMWNSSIEDKLLENERKLSKLLADQNQKFAKEMEQMVEANRSKIDSMNEGLKIMGEHLTETIKEAKMAQNNLHNDKNLVEKNVNISTEEIGVREMDIPKNSLTYMPETTYISGYLVGGMSVSTSVNAPDNATPLIIMLTNKYTSLPKNFKLDFSTCKIFGSGYGDISSERAIIRLEKMVCSNPKTNLVTTTDISGYVHGPDGANGIKGKVISVGSKHIKNAVAGSLLSGLSSSAKGQDAVNITGFGGLSSKKKGMGEMLGGGALTGASNAGEKIADYYLRQAESMSPVLVIPSGVYLDVVFSKGVHIGERGVKAKSLLKEWGVAINMEKIFVLCILILNLSGCSAYKNSFDCAAAGGLACTPLSITAQKIQSGEIEEIEASKCKGKNCKNQYFQSKPELRINNQHKGTLVEEDAEAITKLGDEIYVQ